MTIENLIGNEIVVDKEMNERDIGIYNTLLLYIKEGFLL